MSKNDQLPEFIKGDLKEFISYIKSHPTAIMAICYVALLIIGAFYSWFLYKRFGINYYQFASIEDILFGALRQPVAIFHGIYAGIGVTVLMRLGKKSPFRYTTKTVTITIILSFFYMLVSTFFIAKREANLIVEGRSSVFEVEFKLSPKDKDPVKTDYRYIGKLGSFHAVYNDKLKKCELIPINSINKILIKKKGEYINFY